MKYLLDTNAVVALLNGEASFVRTLRRRKSSGVVMSSIVLHELYFGAFASERRNENVERLQRIRIATVDFDEDDARHAGEIRAALKATGCPIGPYDVLIAGQARSRNLVLITGNVGEFERVDGLRVENWLPG